MKAITLYIAEASNKIFHTSNRRIGRLSRRPMWFAVEESHARKGWHKNNIDESKPSYIYQATLPKKIAKSSTKKIRSLFAKAGLDLDDYIIDLVSNPDSRRVMRLEGTKLLVRSGYSSFLYKDYDPRNWQNDLDALLVFNPKESIKGFRDVTDEVKSSRKKKPSNRTGREEKYGEFVVVFPDGVSTNTPWQDMTGTVTLTVKSPSPGIAKMVKRNFSSSDVKIRISGSALQVSVTTPKALKETLSFLRTFL